MLSEYLFVLFSSVRVLGIHHAQILFMLSLSFKITSNVFFPTPNRSASYGILTLPLVSIASLTESVNPALIILGRPDLLSASVDVLPAENLLCHLYTSFWHMDGFPVASDNVFIVSTGDFPKVRHILIIVPCSPPFLTAPN